uniref:Uncharacterized protein n=1 Tax=viral metagenome TaxID=1070528 RepID=A0A6H1ZLC9_9ZZZZ
MADQESESQIRETPKCPECRKEEAQEAYYGTERGDEVVVINCKNCEKKAERIDKIYFFVFTTALILYAIAIFKIIEIIFKL